MSLEKLVLPLLKFGEQVAARHVCVAADTDFRATQAAMQERLLTLYQEIESADN
jgi:hypothetical protein